MLKKIAVLVSGGGTNLQALLDAQGTVLTHGKIALVISDKENAYALTRAENAGVSHRYIPKGAAFEQALSEALCEYQIDLIVLAGFLSILSADFVRAWDRRILNIHPSLIPSFCGDGFYGLRVHRAALDKGVKVSGATVHYVNEVVDGGAIIAQKAVDVLEGDTPETLQKRIMEQAEWVILPKACELVCQKLENTGGTL